MLAGDLDGYQRISSVGRCANRSASPFPYAFGAMYASRPMFAWSTRASSSTVRIDPGMQRGATAYTSVPVEDVEIPIVDVL